MLSGTHLWVLNLFALTSFVSGTEPSGIQVITGPGAAGSGMPFFAAARDGGAILSWLEPSSDDAKSQSLRIARWRNRGWRDAVTVRSSPNWFINWADIPSVVEMQDGSLMAHWLERTGSERYGYGVRIARAAEWNSKWQEVFFARPSDPADYSGFLSWAISRSGKARAAYLAPPATQSRGEHRKTLRTVTFHPSGAVASDSELDADTCSCCPTSLAATAAGMVIAYRDHAPDEIRDISVVWERNGKWSTPQPLHHDGWRINGCPTEGPSMAAEGNTIGVAWLTRAGDKPRVQVAFSREHGKFESPVRVDDGDPVGRPGTAWADGDLLVVWLEKSKDAVDVRLRRVATNGSTSASVLIASAPGGRAAGIPKIAVTRDGTVLVAWRDGRVRTAALDMGRLPTLRAMQAKPPNASKAY